jgi:hypothetical protein
MGGRQFLGAQEQEEDHAVIGAAHKDPRALNPILASTAALVMHNSLMISAMHPDGAYIRIG